MDLSNEQIRTKAVFWARCRLNKAMPTAAVTLGEAIQVTGDHRLNAWWSPEFSTWFSTSTSFEEEIEYLVQQLPRHVEDILCSEASAATRLAALKLVATLAGRDSPTPASNANPLAGKSADELRDYIKSYKLKAVANDEPTT